MMGHKYAKMTPDKPAQISRLQDVSGVVLDALQQVAGKTIPTDIA
jgi:hypothetical protein